MRGRGRSSLCARQSRLGERGSQKACPRPDRGSFSSVNSPIPACAGTSLGVQRLHIDRGLCRLRFRLAKSTGSPFQQLILPLPDLVGMHIKLLRQFRQRLLAHHGGKRHLGLECRAVVPARSLRHRSGEKSTYPWCLNFPNQLSHPDAPSHDDPRNESSEELSLLRQ